MVEELILSLKKCTSKNDIQFIIDIIKVQCTEEQIEKIRIALSPNKEYVGYVDMKGWRWSINYKNKIFYSVKIDLESPNFIYL